MNLKLILSLVYFSLLFPGLVFAEQNRPLIMFDQGHDQRFVIEERGELQLSRLADVFRDSGSQVVSNKKALSDVSLKGTTALVISGAFASLKPEEIEAVVRFVDGGGRLAVMLHIGSPVSELLARFDLDHSNAVLYERNNIIDAANNFRVTDLSPSPLFAGLSQFSLYGAWALDPGKNGVSLARTSPEAWADLDGDRVLSRGDAVGVFTVVVSGMRGLGSFVVFGDDAIFQNRYLDENNTKLAANLGLWLVGK